MHNFSDKVSLIWQVADLLRGPYRPNQYGKVILPLTVLRRLDCVLEPTREKVRLKAEDLRRKGTPIHNLEPVLNRAAMPPDWPKDRPFPLHNTSKFDFRSLAGDPNNFAKNLTHYIKCFSSKAREIIEYFGFAEHIEKLDKANRLYLVVFKFAAIGVLSALPTGKAWTNRAAFLADLDAAFDAAGVKLAAPVRKAIVAALGARDEAAAICVDDDGHPEPDPDLRDNENVPLKEDIHAYFDREVRPHVPDAWIATGEKHRDRKDGLVGVVGYELPVTRHFYVYQPPRDLSAIAADITGLEKDIVRMLAEVTK